MFINNINPDLLNIGPFSIRFYGIVYALGFLLITYMLSKAAEQKKIKGLDKNKATDLAIFTMIAGLIGARIFHVVSDFYLYKDNLWNVFAIWNGGLGFLGGLVGGILAIYFYCKKHKIDTIKVLDVMALWLPLVIALGRIANFINSEHLGFASNLPWCVVYEKIDVICRHPTQIYESLSMFILFFVLLILYKYTKEKKGKLTWSFILGYGIARFTTDFFRMNQSIYVLGLCHTQWLSLAMIIIGIYFLVKKVKK